MLIRNPAKPSTAIGTFDSRDLNAYLLTVIGLLSPDEAHEHDFMVLAQKARQGKAVPLRDLQELGRREPLTFLPENANLMKAVETFGKGMHRVIVVKENSQDVVGVLSQSRLVRFLWENGRSFPAIDQLYPYQLRDLRIGSQNVVSIK